MLRKFSLSLFTAINHARQINLKPCGTLKSDMTPVEQLDRTVKALGPYTMLRVLLTAPEYKNIMFPRIFKVSADKVPSLHNIIHQADDFNALIVGLPKKLAQKLVETLSSDMASLQKLLAPLSGKNQRQVLDFIGLDRIAALGKHDSLMSKESSVLEFFMISESLNSVLKRKNHNYLYEMRDREQPSIAASPKLGEM